MLGISDKVAKDFGLGDDQWELMAFNLVNGTSVDISIDLFDPQVANTVNIPTIPSPSLTLPPITYYLLQSPPLSSVVERNQAMTYDINNSKVWTGALLGIGVIQSINEITNVVNSTQLLLQDSITGVAYSVTSNKVIFGSDISATVTILDGTTEAILANTALAGGGVSYIIWNSIKNTWYVARKSKQVDEVDCVTNALVSSIFLSGTATPRSIAFDSVTNRIYVTDDSSPLGIDANEVFEIDCATNTVLSVISTTGIIARPFGIGFKYVSGVPTLYLGSYYNAGIYAYNLITTSSTAISLTSFSTNFLVHPTSNTVYSGGWLGGTSGELLLIDSLTNLVTNTINYTFVTLQKIVNITYSPTTNNLYFSTQQPIEGLNTLLPPTAFYISGDSDINQIVRDGFYSPYWIRRLYFYSSNTQNFNQNFFLLTKDANGNLCEFPQVPSLSVATLQFQAGIGLVDYPNKEFILGINQWYKELKVVANSELSLILVYQQLEKSDLLSYIDKTGRGIGASDIKSITNQDVPKYNLEQLNFIMPVNALVLPKDEIITPLNVQELNNILSNAITNSSNGTS
jgi:hypothetical protein